MIDHEHVVDEPERWRSFAGDTPAWVFTHRSLPPVPGADVRFVQGDVVPVHAEMAAVAGDRNLWIIGGGELVGKFVDAGLLDELILGVAPVTLGSGAPLLPRRLVGRLTLVGVEQDKQFAILTYTVGP
jgi:dihydrofolate reductase